ncbi:MAG: transcriptional repressor [Clostridiales bacterium]|nr:transcriptional repressor [Clostridiales bacterium]MBS5877395.1 transcriptional repressor [Clostridiales bacterium]MDU0939236.1 Fur family transcriptional regulator [Clostridiales bacterium]MDU1042119.1 Fur family transcriptional regulator [Clostridiales bacterium]MDU3490290.1 Fur family transcriptional regulator [Clostridiales bacterium]
MGTDLEISGNKPDETTRHLIKAMLRYLRKEGFRITSQRELILEAIAMQVGWHVHPKAVYSYAHERDKEIGLATVYRTIKILEDMDLLNQVYAMGTKNHSAGESAHYHMICLNCGTIHDMTDSLTQEIKNQLKKDYGFIATNMNLSVYGLCSACKKSMDRNRAYPKYKK